jgi:1-acyl-sn-glycerol-3-phosphate acyltransferase
MADLQQGVTHTDDASKQDGGHGDSGQPPHRRTLVSWLYGAFAWLVFVSCLALAGGAAVIVLRPALARRILRCGARLACFLCDVHLSIAGTHHLPRIPHMLVLNHTSFMDPVALMALLPAEHEYVFAVRQQLRLQAVLYPLLRSIGTVILKRQEQPHAAPNVALLVRALENGNSVVVFPEGAFGSEPGLRHFHSGAFVAAAQANAPVVAAALFGSSDVLPPRTWLPRRAPVKVIIGKIFHAGQVAALGPAGIMEAAYEEIFSLQNGK